MQDKHVPQITRKSGTISEPQMQKILVLWALFTSGNDIALVTDDIWNQKIKKHLEKDFPNPGGFLSFARKNAPAFTYASGLLGPFTQDLWGGGGICPVSPIDWIIDMLPQ